MGVENKPVSLCPISRLPLEAPQQQQQEVIVAISGEYGSGSDAAGPLENSGRSPIQLSLCVASMQ